MTLLDNSSDFLLNIGLTPCPNDTFMLYRWIKHQFESQITLKPQYHDIQTLNQMALEAKLPFTKISAALLPVVQENYALLPIGMAMGYNCGPKLISKKGWNISKIPQSTLAFPGQHTSAYLLFNKFFPKPQKELFLPYHTLCSSINDQIADASVIIHETRFTFEKYNLIENQDLGQLWFSSTQLPLPLGIWVLRKDHLHLKKMIESCFEKSLKDTDKNDPQLRSFVLDHAQEKDWPIANQHIDLYVNEFSFKLNPTSLKALELFCDCPCPV